MSAYDSQSGHDISRLVSDIENAATRTGQRRAGAS